MNADVNVDRPPDDAVWAMADLVTPMALRVAATLRLADHIARGARTPTALAGVTGTDPGALRQLLGHLVTVGILERSDDGDDEGDDDGEDGFRLTARGEVLREADPAQLRSLLDIGGGLGRADLCFVELLHAVRTGTAAYRQHFGAGFWDDLDTDPARTASYDAQMGTDVAAWAPFVVGALDWTRFGHVVDVGGGNGTLLAALLAATPGMRGTVVERPATAEAARETLDGRGLGDRSNVIAGDFFDTLPAGADAYVLCAVLHDWDDTSAAMILRRCAGAVGGSGRVLVVEKTGADGESPRTDMDLRVLAYFGARERGVADLTALARAAGLAAVATHRGGDLTVLELAAT
jgi:O-methyltransferase domain